MKKCLAPVLLLIGVVLSLGPVVSADGNEQQVTADIVFENRLSIKDSKPTTEEVFMFTLTPENSQLPMPIEGNKVTITGTGKGKFSKLTFTKPGSYHYTLVQGSGSTPGYSYDTTKYKVTVFVSYSEETSSLKASIVATEIGKQEKKELIFEPVYMKKTANKSGNIPKAGEVTSVYYLGLGLLVIGLAAVMALKPKR
ncbi:Spy0128 family protein [Streptococcus castoreus]|uniref:Spy0128 family protein n=1 Tax=Streptococcus castoreus TaxID=254786 RepID=UPI0003FE6B89|nr:FctA domain-containing protein [Streptococcus castoreus]